jgi:hypothetical protein
MCDFIEHIDSNSQQYSRIMHRRMNWEPFGKEAGQTNSDAYSTLGDEVFMEMVKETRTNDLNKTKPYYYKFYEDLCMSDEMIEENHKRFTEHSKKYETVRVQRTDNSGGMYHIYVTRPVTIHKYSAGPNGQTSLTYTVPKPMKKERDLNGKNNEEGDDNNSETNEDVVGKYVPPSILKKQHGIPEEEPKNRNLFVSNIPREYMEDNIADTIDCCGKIYDIRIHRDKYTGESKGSAIVKCETHETACKIIEKFSRCVMGNQMVHIAFAEDRKNQKGGRRRGGRYPRR